MGSVSYGRYYTSTIVTPEGMTEISQKKKKKRLTVQSYIDLQRTNTWFISSFFLLFDSKLIILHKIVSLFECYLAAIQVITA